jgi:hypothetical protein
MGTVVVSLVGIENYSAVHQAQTLEAHWIAEAGIQRALTYLSRESGNCTAITGGSWTNVTLGRGTFTVTATRYITPSTPASLTANINATDTTITVGSTTGYAPRGRMAIESELIGYSGTTGTTFTGAKRGVDGTTAAAHTSGAVVSQDQCSLTSTGTVSAGFGDAKRVVEVAVQ